MECEQDIPPKIRQEWLTEALRHVVDPCKRKVLQAGIQRLRQASKRPKYPVLYGLRPLVDLAFGVKSGRMRRFALWTGSSSS